MKHITFGALLGFFLFSTVCAADTIPKPTLWPYASYGIEFSGGGFQTGIYDSWNEGQAATLGLEFRWQTGTESLSVTLSPGLNYQENERQVVDYPNLYERSRDTSQYYSGVLDVKSIGLLIPIGARFQFGDLPIYGQFSLGVKYFLFRDMNWSYRRGVQVYPSPEIEYDQEVREEELSSEWGAFTWNFELGWTAQNVFVGAYLDAGDFRINHGHIGYGDRINVGVRAGLCLR